MFLVVFSQICSLFFSRLPKNLFCYFSWKQEGTLYLVQGHFPPFIQMLTKPMSNYVPEFQDKT